MNSENVFIDSNIYIKMFTGYPSLDYFNKLEQLVKTKKFTLIFPRIIREEVYRHISAIIEQEIQTPKLAFAQITKIISEEINQKLKKIEESSSKEYQEEYEKQAKTKRDMAKNLFGQFLDLTVEYHETNAVYDLATKRKNKRYSPGKHTDPLGDQFVWEILLKNCTDKNLIIVSDDLDWKNRIDSKTNNINPFLLREWMQKAKDKKLELIEKLPDLIKKFENEYQVPDIEIQKEKQEPFFNGNPYYLNPQNMGTASLVSTAPMGTYAGTGPTGPTILGGSPAFLPKSTQAYIDLSSIPKIMKCPECGEIVAYKNIDNPCPNCGSALYK